MFLIISFSISRAFSGKDKTPGSAFHLLCPSYSASLPTAPTAIRLGETFNFTFNDLLFICCQTLNSVKYNLDTCTSFDGLSTERKYLGCRVCCLVFVISVTYHFVIANLDMQVCFVGEILR